MRRKAHHTQFPDTPSFRTISVTRLGVSVEKVVATIEIPNSHQGMLLPERKYSLLLLPALLLVQIPIPKVIERKAMIIPQSSVEITI